MNTRKWIATLLAVLLCLTYLPLTAGAASVTVTFSASPSGGGSVTGTVGGSGFVSGNSVSTGETVTLTATAATGYTFAGWSGGSGGSASGNTWTFSPSASPTSTSVSVTATFTPEDKLTVSGTITLNSSGLSGVTVSGGGASGTTNSSGYYELKVTRGTSVTVTPSLSGYTFSPADKPLGAVTSNQTGVNFTASTKYTVTATTNNSNGTVSGGGTFDSGASCTLTATPKTGYTFSHYSDSDGNRLSTSATYTFTVTKTQTITANFSGADLVTISGKLTNPNGSAISGATVSWSTYSAKSNSSGEYSLSVPRDSNVTVTPSLSGYTWSPQNSVLGAVTSDRTGINFTGTKSVTIQVAASPADGGTVSGGKSVQAGEKVTITATPKAGWTFIRWSLGSTQASSSATYTFTASNSATYTAVFAQDARSITFLVKDGRGNPVPDAIITINDENYATDENGEIVIPIFTNTATAYSVSKERYSSMSDTILAGDGDETINVALLQEPPYAANFTITDNAGTPIEDAALTYVMDAPGADTGAAIAPPRSLLTNEEGRTGAVELPAGSYSFYAAKNGYSQASGTFTITNGDEAVDIRLAPSESFKARVLGDLNYLTLVGYELAKVYPSGTRATLEVELSNIGDITSSSDYKHVQELITGQNILHAFDITMYEYLDAGKSGLLELEAPLTLYFSNLQGVDDYAKLRLIGVHHDGGRTEVTVSGVTMLPAPTDADGQAVGDIIVFATTGKLSTFVLAYTPDGSLAITDGSGDGDSTDGGGRSIGWIFLWIAIILAAGVGIFFGVRYLLVLDNKRKAAQKQQSSSQKADAIKERLEQQLDPTPTITPSQEPRSGITLANPPKPEAPAQAPETEKPTRRQPPWRRTHNRKPDPDNDKTRQ